jgi:class 3 adenylate cyclase
MKATNKPYSISDSDERMRDILSATDQAFEESTEIPHADRLTYENGFHIDCAALFIDIRGSSKLVEAHTRPVLGKIYRAYISECVAVMNQDPNCGEIFIQGDCVGGVFHTPRKPDTDSIFHKAAQLNSVITHMNWRLIQRGYTELVCGIGLSFGRALMIKAGYKGSGINDVIWMGNVVNEAAKLCHQGNRGDRSPIQVSAGAYANLNDHNKGLLSPVREGWGLFLDSITHYEGNFVDPVMDSWTKDKKELAKALAARLAGGGLLGLKL